MIKRQRHYSGWEIAGLIGSTLCLLYLSITPLFFFLTVLVDLLIGDILGMGTALAVLALIAGTVSLAFRQWFMPRPFFSAVIIIAHVAVIFIIMLTSIITIFDVMALSGEADDMIRPAIKELATLTVTTVLVGILPIWMNRPRWRKVLPKPEETFL